MDAAISDNQTMTKSKASILVIDDEPDLRLLYELTLLREGYAVESAECVQQARDRLAQSCFDVVLTDMRLPDGMGMEILQDLQQARRTERCIVVTAYGSAENAVEALRAGAFDYLTKPVELKQLRTVVASAVQGQEVLAGASGDTDCKSHDPAADCCRSTQADPGGQGQAALARLVGQSAVMQAVKGRIAKVARSMAPVHIHGASGTGKELVAQALHANSQRADGPLVAVNCGAIPENLLEAEFFGAKKGSYTGAVQDRIGFFQAAQGGTLFLDEIGDLPLPMQTKLLRAIQERRVRPLGATQEEAVNVRLVSATHKDLAQEVAAGRFRQDLYYRLNVIEIRIPPLRERREDLPELVQALLARLAQDAGMAQPPQITPEFMQAITCRDLPGNVRELENLLHRAVALSDGHVLQAASIAPDGDATPVVSAVSVVQEPNVDPAPTQAPAHQTAAASRATDLRSWLDAQERGVLTQALRGSQNDLAVAAEQLGLSVRQLRYRLERLGMAVE